MPYIDEDDREKLDYGHAAFRAAHAGELNYVITRAADEYLDGAVNYAAINEVIGVLECVKLELYRRVAAPYEDLKMGQNGDVYEHRSWMP